MIGRNAVSCEALGQDSYDRTLAICRSGGQDINAAMVRAGWAMAFIRYSDRYAGQEAEARANRAGLWAGAFDPPWDWRAGRIAGTELPDCPIKGNISGEGERIYHMPFHQHYGRTRIDEGAGEQWFCAEDEAQAAGWRRALR